MILWTWLTDHFVAQIVGYANAPATETGTAAVRAYEWSIADRISPLADGSPRPLLADMAGEFSTAERAIREHIGKAYSPRLGYDPYTGTLATTFTIATGEHVNFAPFTGRAVTVDVFNEHGTLTRVSGTLTIHAYKIRVTVHGQQVEIRPEHVNAIALVNAAHAPSGIAPSSTATVHPGGRVVTGTKTPGCTGAIGYLAGTVDHGNAPPCPVHEMSTAHRP